MRGVNICVVGGNLGRDPEGRSTSDGKRMVTFSLALSRKVKGIDREDDKESLLWVTVVCFGDLAQICERNLSKGDEVLVHGGLSVNEWEDRATGEKQRSWEIQAKDVSFLKVRKWGERQQARI